MISKYLTSLSKALRLLSQKADEEPKLPEPREVRFRRNESGTITALGPTPKPLTREYALAIVGGDRHLCIHDEYTNNSLRSVCGNYSIYNEYNNEDFEILCYTEEEPSDVCAVCIAVALDLPPPGYVPEANPEPLFKKMTLDEVYALEHADPTRPLNMFEREYISKIKAVAQQSGIDISYLDEDFLDASARKHYNDFPVRKNVNMSGRFSLDAVYDAIVIPEVALQEAREYVKQQILADYDDIPLLTTSDTGDEVPLPPELAMLFSGHEEEAPEENSEVDMQILEVFLRAERSTNERES